MAGVIDISNIEKVTDIIDRAAAELSLYQGTEHGRFLEKNVKFIEDGSEMLRKKQIQNMQKVLRYGADTVQDHMINRFTGGFFRDLDKVLK